MSPHNTRKDEMSKEKVEFTSTKKQELNRLLKSFIGDKRTSFPVTINHVQGMGEPSFKITIEKFECDTFVDSKGQKWKKVVE